MIELESLKEETLKAEEEEFLSNGKKDPYLLTVRENGISWKISKVFFFDVLLKAYLKILDLQ